MREDASGVLHTPKRWTGGLRRTAQALAIQGSNTIEGYTVSEDDALAAVDDQEPLSADERTWAEIMGYRRVLTYVLQMAGDSELRIDSQLLRTLHFASIEEWLGHNTQHYYEALTATGQGGWNPQKDAHDWGRFNLRAHHIQGQTVSRRIAEAEVLGAEILRILEQHGLPERVFDPLFDAALGLRVRRPAYVKRTGVEERTATRDLKALTDAGLLAAHGQTKGRYYVAAGEVREMHEDSRRSAPPSSIPIPSCPRRSLNGRASSLRVPCGSRPPGFDYVSRAVAPWTAARRSWAGSEGGASTTPGRRGRPERPGGTARRR